MSAKATNLFERIFANVDDALNTYVVDTVGNVVGFASPLFTSMMIVFVAMWGYLMMFGRVQEPLQDGVFRIIRIGGIMALGLTVGTYMGVVVTFLQQGPEHISAVVSGAGGTSADTLDALFSQVFAVSKAAWDKGGVLDGNFGLYLIALIVLVIGSGLTLFVAFLILLAKLMTTVLLGIGPLFIICLLFKVTQRFFESWIAMVSNFGLLLVLASAVGTLMTSLAQTYITRGCGHALPCVRPVYPGRSSGSISCGSPGRWYCPGYARRVWFSYECPPPFLHATRLPSGSTGVPRH